MKDRVYETHPSFGTMGFFRTQSSGRGPRLFQSHTDNSTFIHLVIKHAEVCHDLGRDWVHGNKTIVDVAISAAQFAELLTTMNIGEGIPCTITQLGGDSIPPPPAKETVAAKVRNAFRKEVQDAMEGLEDKRKEIQEMLSKPSLNKADRELLSRKMNELVNLFSSHAPFMFDSFEEAVEKTVVGAKAEVDAFLTTAIHQAGLDHLRSQAPSLSMIDEPKVVE
jgi:hypothetical protein